MVSVIIPVYKTEKYLEATVNSVLNQTYKNIEIILVNDGSPDNCPQLCDNITVLKLYIKRMGGFHQRVIQVLKMQQENTYIFSILTILL